MAARPFDPPVPTASTPPVEAIIAAFDERAASIRRSVDLLLPQLPVVTVHVIDDGSDVSVDIERRRVMAKRYPNRGVVWIEVSSTRPYVSLSGSPRPVPRDERV